MPHHSQSIPVVPAAQSQNNETTSLATVLNGYTILDEVDGDIDGDGTSDRLLVLKSTIEDQYTAAVSAGTTDTPAFEKIQNDIDSNPDFARKMVIVLNQKSGPKIFVNNAIVLPVDGGGVFGDPYNGIAIDAKNHLVSVSDFGGSADKWGDTITFSYDNTQNNFYLYSIEHTAFNDTDQEQMDTPDAYTINANELPKIAFEQYTGLDAPNTCYVITQPVSLYSEPIAIASNVRGTIKAGVKFPADFETNTFVFVSSLFNDPELGNDFTHLTGPYTDGFISKSVLSDPKYGTVSPMNADGSCQ